MRGNEITNALSNGNDKNTEDNNYQPWGERILDDTSAAILNIWYSTARDRVFGNDGRKRNKVPFDEISEDDEDDLVMKWSAEPLQMTEATSFISIYWLRSARSRLQNRTRQMKSNLTCK